MHLFPTSKAGTALPLSSDFFPVLYEEGAIWGKQSQYSPAFMFLVSQVGPGLEHAYFICQGTALFHRLGMCHLHVIKDDSVSQLTVFDLRNVSDKYLDEIEACKLLDLMNHHSLDKRSFLKIDHSWNSS